ncbi:MAG: tetratricopeptide repeat protein [Chlorobi bacterium]|nr:tetratricopeptide repeat protein [Chlorobiota bacterium]MCI0717248.1 tetratricopeptide repeat protein [Chlorobiota bacterium]
MKLSRTLISVFLSAAVILYINLYINGCSSAEQTTAKLAYQQGDYEKAAREFEKEVKQNPQNEEAWFYLALSNAKLGRIDGTKEAISQYRKIGKNSFTGELTDVWGRQYDDGYKLYQEGEAQSKAGKDNEAIKKFQQALKNFEIAFALLPDSVVAKENIKALNNRINTITVKPLIDKGVELEKEGNYEGAINEYKKALEQVSKGSASYEVIIYDISVANLKWGEKMREANSEDPAYKSKYEAALPYLEELTNSEDKDNKLTAYELLIQVYANLGMTDKATEAMKMRDKLKEENK